MAVLRRQLAASRREVAFAQRALERNAKALVQSERAMLIAEAQQTQLLRVFKQTVSARPGGKRFPGRGVRQPRCFLPAVDIICCCYRCRTPKCNSYARSERPPARTNYGF